MNADRTAVNLIEAAMRGVRIAVCGRCDGIGETLEGPCKDCDGAGLTTTTTELETDAIVESDDGATG
jgi:DnaJ-class molecular chaperone